MKPNKGLSRNHKRVEQPPGTIPFGKNGIDTIALQNEPGFSVCAARIPFQQNGFIETDTNPIIFSTDDTYSAIGFFNEVTGQYDPIINDFSLPFKFGFKRDNPIKGVARRNYKNELEIAWVEMSGDNPPRFLNVSNLGTDLKDFMLFPEYVTPNLVVSTTGGSLEMATYFVAQRYINKDGTETRYSTISTPVSVRADDFKAPGTTTSRGLMVLLSNLDQTYDKVQLAVVKRLNGVTTAIELDPYTLTGPEMSIQIPSLQGTDIAIEEVLIPPAFYIQGRRITQLNDVLYLADLEEPEAMNLQAIANKAIVIVESKIRKINLSTPDKDIADGSFRTFKHGEVVAAYVVFQLTSGLKTDAYHIPGLEAPAVGTDMTIVNDVAYERFQVEDTISDVRAVDSFTLRFRPGIWANKDEKYPDHTDFSADGLVGRVRHHRMPFIGTMANMYRDALPSDYKYGVNCMDFLGLSVSNIIIPDALKGKIAGWEIYYAKRSYDNSLIAGQGCVTFPAKIRNTEAQGKDTYWTTGGNFDSTVGAKLGTYAEGQISLDIKTDTYLRVHSPDLTVIKPSVSPNLLRFNYSLRTSMSLLFRDDAMLCTLADYTNTAVAKFTAAGFENRNFNRRFSSSSYIPNMGVVGNLNNLKGEPAFIGKHAGGAIYLNKDYSKNFQKDNTPPHIPLFEETHIVDVVTVKDNVYSNFSGQDLVRIGYIEPTSSTKSEFHYGGDCFIVVDSYYSHGLTNGIETNMMHTSAKNWDPDNTQEGRMDPNDGNKVARLFLCESGLNLWQRYKDPGLPTSAFYPQTVSTDHIKALDRTVDNNMYGYDRSASSLADLTQGVRPHSVDNIKVSKAPFRIIRSLTQSREGKRNSWKQFSALDYFEAQKDMGPIMNIVGYDDRLIIHHKNALFITQDKTTLQGDILSVTLGTGDIFRFPPKQGKPSKLGYAGTQHPLAAVMTGAGYVFPDTETGELFILNEQGLDEISGELSNFFLEHFRVSATNVFKGDGITIGYDNRFKRLLVTKKEGETSFTLSYNIARKHWSFFHDYLADAYIHTRKHTYAAKTLEGVTRLYRMNDGLYGLYFDRSATKPFIMDVVFAATGPMILNSVSWHTEVTLFDNSEEEEVTLWNETISAITIWNNYQCTGRIVLDKEKLGLLNRNNRNIEQTWRFNDFRNLVKQDGTAFLDSLFNDFKVLDGKVQTGLPWYDKGLLKGKYFVVRFEFENKDNKQITIHDVDLSVSASKQS